MAVTTQSPTVVRGLGDPGRYLLPEEIVVVGVRRHILVLGAALLETIGFVAGALMLQYLFEYTPLIDRICAVIILVALIRMAYLVIEWRMERFVISNQRMMLISGVITRRVAAVPLRKVTDLTFEKPLLGHLFGYGTFIIESAGQDQAMSHVAYLPKANRLYIKVSDLLFGTGMPQVDHDLVVDASAAETSAGLDDDAADTWDYEADRQDTDPSLGEKLAGLDFAGPPPERGTSRTARPDREAQLAAERRALYPADPPGAQPPSRPDRYDPEGDRLPSTEKVTVPGLQERQRSEAAQRLLASLGGLHGRGVRRDTGRDPLTESPPPRWARRG